MKVKDKPHTGSHGPPFPYCRHCLGQFGKLRKPCFYVSLHLLFSGLAYIQLRCFFSKSLAPLPHQLRRHLTISLYEQTEWDSDWACCDMKVGGRLWATQQWITGRSRALHWQSSQRVLTDQAIHQRLGATSRHSDTLDQRWRFYHTHAHTHTHTHR